MRSAVSLDAPLSDEPGEEDLRFADVIPDPAAEAPFLATDLEAAIEEALAELPEEERRIIQSRYWKNEAVDTKAHAAALKLLRHPDRSRRLRAFVRR